MFLDQDTSLFILLILIVGALLIMFYGLFKLWRFHLKEIEDKFTKHQ